MTERTLGSYSNMTVRVTYKALHVGELYHEVTVENRNDAYNTERIKVVKTVFLYSSSLASSATYSKFK